MEMMTASQPHVTRRPVHRRCSSQPIGLRSSFQRIQRRNNVSQIIGVQNVDCHQSRALEGGLSCHTRRVLFAAIRIVSSNPSTEKLVRRPIARSTWAFEGEKTKRRYGAPPMIIPKPVSHA